MAEPTQLPVTISPEFPTPPPTNTHLIRPLNQIAPRTMDQNLRGGGDFCCGPEFGCQFLCRMFRVLKWQRRRFDSWLESPIRWRAGGSDFVISGVFPALVFGSGHWWPDGSEGCPHFATRYFASGHERFDEVIILFWKWRTKLCPSVSEDVGVLFLVTRECFRSMMK